MEHRHCIKLSKIPNEPEHVFMPQEETFVDKELVEALLVCDEFDRNFNEIKKNDVVFQMKEIDSNYDIAKIVFDQDELKRILKNEK